MRSAIRRITVRQSVACALVILASARWNVSPPSESAAVRLNTFTVSLKSSVNIIA